MAITKYIVHTFNSELATQGSLCAMVKTSVADGSTVSTAPETGTTEPTLMGVGICRINNNRYVISINSISYVFTELGNYASSNARGYKLMMAETLDKATDVGNAVETSTTIGITRGADGSVSYTETEEDNSVIISGLEARDQFAIQALKTLMGRVDRDPVSMSDNEKMYICESAYQWAANMMTQASKVRANIETETGGGTTSTDNITRGMVVDNSEVSTVSEKLLNNIVAALEKTDERHTIIDGQTQITTYSERVSIPKLIEWLTAYSHHTPTEEGDTKQTVGLDDLINAIKEIGSGGGGGSTTVDFTDLITALNTTQTIGIRGTLPDVNIGDAGLGRDNSHPLYISGGGFPTRNALAAVFDAATLSDFLTFNTAGAVGYSTKAEVKKATLGYLNDYATLSALATAILAELTANSIYNKIQSLIDSRIRAWLEAARDAENRSLTVNTPT